MKRFLRFFLSFLFVLAISIGLAKFLFPLPDIENRVAVSAIPPSDSNLLGKLAMRSSSENPGLSGVSAIGDGKDAFTSRLALIENAQVSLDAQYYIWHDDTSGILLLDALDRAAKRGVKIRLLLDDNGIPNLDQFVATLNSHENFSIRLFNPSTIRNPKFMGYTFNLLRMNRRMHNKSIIADGAATIIGGRNIGDEYFEFGEVFYKDMDVLAVGSIVSETASVFDQYWNSASVFNVEDIIDGNGDRNEFDVRIETIKKGDHARLILSDPDSSVTRYIKGKAPLEWTTVNLVADDPIKGQGKAKRDQLMITKLAQIIGPVSKRLDLISAYFIPGVPGTEYFTKLAGQGKEVNVLTNAMNTTDVLLVHSGYTKYRRELLEGNVKLFELKLRGGVRPESEFQLKPLGLSGASLHAKTFAIDDERIFIGSFNFDPRSAILNCEMGFLIDSPAMAKRISKVFDDQLKLLSYLPELSADDRMVWKEAQADGKTLTWQQEPGGSWFEQMALAVVGVLPIEWAL